LPECVGRHRLGRSADPDGWARGAESRLLLMNLIFRLVVAKPRIYRRAG
jgi:hypothetical protein